MGKGTQEQANTCKAQVEADGGAKEQEHSLTEACSSRDSQKLHLSLWNSLWEEVLKLGTWGGRGYKPKTLQPGK